MILVLDNYDSFTYNLVQFLGEIIEKSGDADTMDVVRNDETSAEELASRGYDRVVVSPGPCTPDDAGVSCELIERMAGKAPILGVCLGHQSIGQVFGGRVVRAPMVVHGKTSMIRHNGQTLFEGLSNPMEATRYHSLIIERETLPDTLEVTAWTDDGVIMGVKHRDLPVWGVQFHPESILTVEGKRLLANFLRVKGEG
jgi:anthranilate synthase component 2